MLESVVKGLVVIGLGVLLMSSLYVLDRCDFVDHWNPNHPSCVDAGTNVRRGAVAAVVELAERRPGSGDRDFRSGLRWLRAEAKSLHEGFVDFTRQAIAEASAWVDDAYRAVTRWSRSQRELWVAKR